jgi:hypothetical protein
MFEFVVIIDMNSIIIGFIIYNIIYLNRESY